jgi:hypothetical protein
MIKLNSKWSMGSDEDCVIIYAMIKHKKTGEIYPRARWYYPNFKSALEGLIDRDIQSLSTLKDIVKRVEELKADILPLAEILDIQRKSSGKALNKPGGKPLPVKDL